MKKQDCRSLLFCHLIRILSSDSLQVDEAFRPFLPPKFEVLFSWKKPFFESNVPLALCSLSPNIVLYNKDELVLRHEEAPFDLTSTLRMMVGVSTLVGEEDITKAIQDSFWKNVEEGRPMSDHVEIFFQSLVFTRLFVRVLISSLLRSYHYTVELPGF